MASAMLDPVLEALCDARRGGIDPKSLADMLQMTQAELAALSGLHRTTLSRNPQSPEVQAKLGPIGTILARATDMASNRNKAVLWFRHQPVPAFGFKRPAELVAQGEAAAVLGWLDALEDGAYG